MPKNLDMGKFNVFENHTENITLKQTKKKKSYTVKPV